MTELIAAMRARGMWPSARGGALTGATLHPALPALAPSTGTAVETAALGTAKYPQVPAHTRMMPLPPDNRGHGWPLRTLESVPCQPSDTCGALVSAAADSLAALPATNGGRCSCMRLQSTTCP